MPNKTYRSSLVVLFVLICQSIIPVVVTFAFGYLMIDKYLPGYEWLLILVPVVWILYLYFRLSIKIEAYDGRVKVKRLFKTYIDEDVNDLGFRLITTDTTHTNQYGSTMFFKTLFSPTKVRLLFSLNGKTIKVDGTGLGNSRAHRFAEDVFDISDNEAVNEQTQANIQPK